IFALQAEAHRLRKEGDDGPIVHHKLPHYVSNMDRLGDSELNMVSSQRHAGSMVQSQKSSGFLSSLLPQSKKAVPSRPPPATISSPTQSSTALPLKKEPANNQAQKTKEVLSLAKEVKSVQSVLGVPSASDPTLLQQRQRRLQERKELLAKTPVDCSGRRVASLDVDGVIKVWSIDGIMQTKASAISKSALLSLEWATKRDRLLLLGSEVGTVRLYDTEAKKNLCEINIIDDMPRILSLACNPSGTSFVCSAAAVCSPTQLEPSVPGLGENGTNQVPGRLLLWDTKTMKQQENQTLANTVSVLGGEINVLFCSPVLMTWLSEKSLNHHHRTSGVVSATLDQRHTSTIMKDPEILLQKEEVEQILS
ncbi:hypothetical protein AB205_0078910, partial [Aquarana catesbeiana]